MEAILFFFDLAPVFAFESPHRSSRGTSRRAALILVVQGRKRRFSEERRKVPLEEIVVFSSRIS